MSAWAGRHGHSTPLQRWQVQPAVGAWEVGIGGAQEGPRQIGRHTATVTCP